jgi:hypothetical protein
MVGVVFINRFTHRQLIEILLIHQSPRFILKIEWRWRFQIRDRGFGRSYPRCPVAEGASSGSPADDRAEAARTPLELGDGGSPVGSGGGGGIWSKWIRVGRQRRWLRLSETDGRRRRWGRGIGPPRHAPLREVDDNGREEKEEIRRGEGCIWAVWSISNDYEGSLRDKINLNRLTRRLL